MLFYKNYQTLAEALISLTNTVMTDGEIVESPDWNTRRIELPAVFTVENPLDQRFVPKATICNDASLFSYVNEILNGTMDDAVESGLEAYTYHSRMVFPVDQIEYCAEELKRNLNSNRAVITIRHPEDNKVEDQPCLQLVQFKVYSGRLNMTTFWRSRDLFKALYMNCFALIRLGVEISEAIQLPFGIYTDHSEGLHIYERDWNQAKQIQNLSFSDAIISADDFWIDFTNPYDTIG
ncbi:MAG: thymidylate synthase [Oscillospiraceae bacterium]|jgi:thymidylate synthase|nr:thymidylate synthase [Oscillospiraceae bacterium]